MRHVQGNLVKVMLVRSDWIALVALYALFCAVFVSCMVVSCMVIDGSSTAHQQSIEGEGKGSVPSGLRYTILLYHH